VTSQLALLPEEISSVFHAMDLSTYQTVLTEDQAIQTSYDLFCSEDRNRIMLSEREKIPDVYSAEDYVFRPNFEHLNVKNNGYLDDFTLAQAMFLHRGVYLQRRAEKWGATSPFSPSSRWSREVKRMM
jgi:hypothetical protein